jgi:hypothetical protein
LAFSHAGDADEQEADRAADTVMQTPVSVLQRRSNLVQRRIAANATGSIPDSLRAPGSEQPLDSDLRAYFEPRFGHDLSNVRVHKDESAAASARSVNALAYTVGNRIVFGRGQYAPHSDSGRRLVAHELAHVVQQSGQAAKVQRTELQGTDDQCVAFEDRQLQVGAGAPLPQSRTPGGRVIPGTRGTSQNCAGASLCGRAEYINWPKLGYEAADHVARPPQITANWAEANEFVPAGCVPVSCSGVNLNSSRCNRTEREVILFLSRWPFGALPNGTVVYQSDFHMIGRTPSSLPMAWESKMDQRERVEDIRDPWQSLYDAYPHTQQPNREIRQHCFCCDCAQIQTR